MKKYCGIFIISLFIFFTGCSENPVTDPGLSLDKQTGSHKGIINICCLLTDPLSGTCNLGGNIMYYHEIIPAPENIDDLFTIRVSLEVDCEMCDKLGMMHPKWSITQSSVDIVIISEEGIVILEKNYPVCNRIDIMLNVKYLITTEGVGIADLSIIPVNPFSCLRNLD